MLTFRCIFKMKSPLTSQTWFVTVHFIHIVLNRFCHKIACITFDWNRDIGMKYFLLHCVQLIISEKESRWLQSKLINRTKRLLLLINVEFQGNKFTCHSSKYWLSSYLLYFHFQSVINRNESVSKCNIINYFVVVEIGIGTKFQIL